MPDPAHANRPLAVPTVQLDTERAIVTEWRFAPGDTIDTLNARLLAARSDLDMIAIVDWLATYHRKVLAQFDKASDEQLSTRADIGWSKPISMSNLIYDMSLHGLKHAEDIWQWKADQVNL